MADAFDDFWAVYPRRKGANPKHPARVKFEAAVRYGADPLAIIDAARRYAIEQLSLKHVGTEFVAQATTWLNQKRWEDYPPPTTEGIKQATETVWIAVHDPRWDYAVEFYRRAYRKTPPVVPGSRGLAGPGWYFPVSLLGEREADATKAPAPLTSSVGSQTTARTPVHAGEAYCGAEHNASPSPKG